MASIGELRDDGGDPQPPGWADARYHPSQRRAAGDPGQASACLFHEPTAGARAGVGIRLMAGLSGRSRGVGHPRAVHYRMPARDRARDHRLRPTSLMRYPRQYRVDAARRLPFMRARHASFLALVILATSVAAPDEPLSYVVSWVGNSFSAPTTSGSRTSSSTPTRAPTAR